MRDEIGREMDEAQERACREYDERKDEGIRDGIRWHPDKKARDAVRRHPEEE